MSTERNKATERRIIAELNAGNIDVVDELFAPGFTYHLAGMPPQGREDFKQLLGMTYSAFPDWHMTEDDMIAEGDRFRDPSGDIPRDTSHRQAVQVLEGADRPVRERQGGGIVGGLRQHVVAEATGRFATLGRFDADLMVLAGWNGVR